LDLVAASPSDSESPTIDIIDNTPSDNMVVVFSSGSGREEATSDNVCMSRVLSLVLFDTASARRDASSERWAASFWSIPAWVVAWRPGSFFDDDCF
jgi:hypothetical protein